MGQKRIIISYKKVSRNRYRFVIHQFGKPLYDRVHKDLDKEGKL